MPIHNSYSALNFRNSVVLSSTVWHYRHAALALKDAGYLKRYICGFAVSGRIRWIVNMLPRKFRTKVASRELRGLNRREVVSVWTGEALKFIFKALGLVSGDSFDLYTNLFHDFISSLWLGKCQVFHFVATSGLHSARRAKQRGATIICDVRTEYPKFQYQVLDEENLRIGSSASAPGRRLLPGVMAEFDMADYFIVPSEYAKRTFIQYGINSNAIFVLPYGVDEAFLARARRDSATSTSTFRVIYVGLVTPRKGIHYLIDAFNMIQEESMELVVVGGIDPAMNAFFHQSCAGNSRIRYLGALSKPELADVYDTGSVFVLPSLADSWGLVVLEAMACGLPVIVTENTGAATIVVNGVNGFVVPIRDSAAVAEQLRYLQQHPSVRVEMGKAAQTAAQKYTWDRYKNGLVEIYQQIACKTDVDATAIGLKMDPKA